MQYCTVVLICISLMNNEVVVCLFAIWLSLFCEVLIQIFCPFSRNLCCPFFFFLDFSGALYIFWLCLLLNILIGNIFSPLLG